MTTQYGRAWRIVGTIALVALNVSFIAFFRFWQIADTASINNMEETVGFDPSFMLPNANLMWIAAHASLLLLVVIDVCAVALWVGRMQQARVAPSRLEQPTATK